jgi:fluoride exporter
MQKVILIGLAGLCGTLARFGLSEAATRAFGDSFPVGTLTVNLLGCFVAGFLMHVFYDRASASELARLSLMVGFLGGFTTFSALGLQTFELFKGGQPALGILNLVVSNLGGLLLVWLGYVVSKLTIA